MPINLKDIPDAVQSYLNTKVSVAISQVAPSSGGSINPGETFEVHIAATNANAASGGVALKNTKYRVSVDNGAIAKLIVPPGAIYYVTDLAGNRLNGNQEVTSMIVDNQIARELAVGDTGTLVSLSGADPLNLAGILTPGPRLAALTRNRVLYRDGVPVALLEGGAVRFLETLEPASEWDARTLLLRSAVPAPLVHLS